MTKLEVFVSDTFRIEWRELTLAGYVCQVREIRGELGSRYAAFVYVPRAHPINDSVSYEKRAAHLGGTPTMISQAVMQRAGFMRYRMARDRDYPSEGEAVLALLDVTTRLEALAQHMNAELP